MGLPKRSLQHHKHGASIAWPGNVRYELATASPVRCPAGALSHQAINGSYYWQINGYVDEACFHLQCAVLQVRFPRFDNAVDKITSTARWWPAIPRGSACQVFVWCQIGSSEALSPGHADPRARQEARS